MRYQWQRVWYEPQDTVFLDDLTGYLLDFEGLHVRDIQKVLPYSAIAQNPCLILLGDAGSGKSTSLAEARQLEKNSPSEAPLWVDLKDLREEGLRLYLFDQPAWRGWREGIRPLEVFLDSLDECYMQLASLPALLVQEIRGGPLDWLRLRVICRTAVWPATLSDQLCNLWPNGTKTYLLAPLRRADVLTAARQRGLDAESFVARVEESGAAPLAAVPQTLELLFRLETGGQFPRT